MYLPIVSRMFMGIGIACFCFALVVEIRAQENYHCWETEYAHCGYHPCTCEDGTTSFGCEEAQDHGPTGYCNWGTSYTCTGKLTSCGKKVSFAAPNTCSSCIGGQLQNIDCNQKHECSDNS